MVEPVDADGDGYTDDVDCDDTDPRVNPGMPELCDGKDTDCDPLTGEAGLVAWHPDDGEPEDLTAVLGVGTAAAPVAYGTSIHAGELRFCEGTYHVDLLLNGDQRIVGDGPSLTTLDGGGLNRLITRGHQDQTYEVRGLHLIHGAAPDDVGGALYFSSDNDVWIDDCVIEASVAGRGGGVALRNVTGLISNTQFVDNSATDDDALGGGGLFVEAWSGAYGPSDVTLTNVIFDGNSASFGSGGAIGIGEQSSVDGTGVDFSDNSPTDLATTGAAGADLGTGASFVCGTAGCD